MAAAASLHLAHLARASEVGNVEDTKPAETFLADIFRNTLKPAIDAAARLLDAHHQNVANDRDIALSAGANNGADKRRHAIGAEAIDVIAVIIARHHHIIEERHIGIGKIEQWRALGELGQAFAILGGFSRFLILAFFLILRHRRLEISRVRRIKEAGRLGKADDLTQVRDRLARIGKTGLQSGARIRR